MPKQNYLTAVLLALCASALLPLTGAIGKALTPEIPAIQVVWARYFGHFILVLPIVLYRFGPRSLWPTKVGWQFIRGFLLCVGTLSFFTGVHATPFGLALALFYVAPLAVAIYSHFFLGEKVGPRRWIAVAIGFVGALVILRPGPDALQWISWLCLFAGFAVGGYLTITRSLAGTAPPFVSLAFTAVVGTLVTSALVPFVWVYPTESWQILFLVAIAVIAAVGHWFLIMAFERAEASSLAPLGYIEIVSASFLGMWFFNDTIDSISWVGVAIVVAAGLYLALRELKLSRLSKERTE
ncbi:DMT family transporter [Alphaproteobacteria bacterium]|nr:DMT family transporter [Alphaproteobacteria bacterium]